MSRQIPKPEIKIISFTVAAPFYLIKIPRVARELLAFASNMRIHGCNVYKLMSNHEIARALNLSYGQFMRAKKILRDKKLLFYDGRAGDYSKVKEEWERSNNEKWEYDL